MPEKFISLDVKRQNKLLSEEMELEGENYLRSNKTEELFYLDNSGNWHARSLSYCAEFNIVNKEFGEALSVVWKGKLVNKK